MSYHKDMKITEFSHPDLVQAVTLYPDSNETTLIHRYWHLMNGSINTTGDDELIDHDGIVYFICVDDEIVKVGGTTDNIKGLLGQYILNLRSKSDPMFTRFPIYLMMLYLLCEGHRIDFYYIPVKPYTINLKDLVTGLPVEVIATDFHGFETGYIQHVADVCGSIPIWNMAENGNSFDPELRDIWETRRLNLANDGNQFDYDSYLSRQWNFLGQLA